MAIGLEQHWTSVIDVVPIPRIGTEYAVCDCDIYKVHISAEEGECPSSCDCPEEFLDGGFIDIRLSSGLVVVVYE